MAILETILIANRGEIACRIIRTCRRLGIRSVAVYSDADSGALHVRLADEAVRLGPAPAGESYLRADLIIEAARRTAADAIHPGFGFLSENSLFAQACLDAGLIFIGPSPGAIAAMGNKRAAREMVARVGVPVVPGYGGGDQHDETLLREAERIGTPLMVKAAAGGGGKGMRLVRSLEELPEALASARREAQQAFGDSELILERALTAARHVEIQVFGDRQGNIIHLGERECSLQRRHQKVIEEAPSPVLTAELRAQMGTAAVAAARCVDYVGAGTVEFLLDRRGDFYFLEMNTRLQVEHPVTECVTGLDLVEWQIRVAEGEALPLRQEEVRLQGHAIEARLYAEDPANEFLPVTGRIALWRAPQGEGIRVESGIQSGDEVSLYYDPMLAKIIAYGPDRAVARRRLMRALEATTLLGLTSNRGFLRAVLAHPACQAGEVSTRFLEEQFAAWQPPLEELPLALVAVTLAQWVRHGTPGAGAGYWRNNPNRPAFYRYAFAGRAQPLEVALTPQRVAGRYTLRLNLEPEQTLDVELNTWDAESLTLTVAGYRRRLTLIQVEQRWWVQTSGGELVLEALSLLPEPRLPADAGGSLRAPMPGAVLAVLVQKGQRVTKGEALLKLEAMKMEHTIRTAADGVVEEIYYGPGDTVAADALLIRLREL